MNKFYIVRHGETEWNKKRICQGIVNNPLNEKGIKDAITLGRTLKELNLHFEVFVSSPLLRAIETMSLIKNELENFSPIIINKGLIERNFGELEGEDVDKVTNSIENGSCNNVKGFENDAKLIERVSSSFKEINSHYKDTNILIVAHSHAIKAFLSYIDPSTYSFFTPLSNLNVSLIDGFEDNSFLVESLHFKK